jgi:hypothetical protein
VEFDEGYFRTTEYQLGRTVRRRRIYRDANGEVAGAWQRVPLDARTTDRERFANDLVATGFEEVAP